MSAQYERKAFALDVKAIDESGSFTGLASVYGNKDLGGDIVDRGAFQKSMEDRGPEVPILWQHDSTEPIGKGSLVDGRDGLTIKGQLSLGTVKGREAYELLKDGVIKGLSIGYDVVKQKFADGARHLQELKLYEVSAVTFPMNEQATVVSVKQVVKAAALTAVGLPSSQVALITGLLAKAAGASLTDKIQAVYESVQDAFPFSNAYVQEVFDDAVIVCTGTRYFSIAITWQDAEGDGLLDDPMLGDATEVERVYQPIGKSDGSMGADGAADDAAKAAKAGRVVSSANSEKLKAACDYMTKAVGHVKDVIAAGAPKKPAVSSSKGVTSDQEDAAIAASLRTLNDQMRRLTTPAA